MTELIGDVRALIDASGAGRVHLVGHDWGAGWLGVPPRRCRTA
ncbi:alpha/beta hydrolase fold domain protein [Mycobacterium xenopi 3993]|nr:alpha/beta hydrolase fold domain protein [Mycobacterium xenopi 3993]